MLNLVPIQFLALLAYFILRLTVGLVFLSLARSHWRHRQELSTELNRPFIPGTGAITVLIFTEILVGTLFIIGLFTQLAAALALVIALKFLLFRSYFTHQSFPTPQTLFLLIGVSVTLFITGAGVLAFDLPI